MFRLAVKTLGEFIVSSILRTGISKIALFVRAAVALRSINLRGCPFIPKQWWPAFPHNRGAYNEFILWIKSLRLPSADSVVDVGANHGDFAQAVSTIFPDARILLVEPVPSLHAELQRRCLEHQSRWSLETSAAGSHCGTANLMIDPENDAIGSLAGFSEEYRQISHSASSVAVVSCQVKPLDQILEERNINHVDLVKVDVEGFEFEVLDGFRERLKATRAIVVEVSLVRLAKSGTNPLELMTNRLTENGFEISAVIPSLYASDDPRQPVEYNILARRPS